MSVNEMLMAAASTGGANEYVEDCFATHLYTGNGSTQTITNGIDLAGKGGLTWIKSRSNTQSHYLIDSERGISKLLNSNNTFGQGTDATNVTAYNSSGFTVQGADVNASTYTYASWTFRKTPKFFDIVTYTGNGANRTIAHNLGSVPGMMIIKRTDSTGTWAVYHRSLATNERLILETTAAVDTSATTWNNTAPTSSVFSVGTNVATNSNGATYVAYLFAHDAGGFGDAGTDNVISCGITSPSGSLSVVELGFEPQFILLKNISGGNWLIFDNLRDFNQQLASRLIPNLSNAESLWSAAPSQTFPTATGFRFDDSTNQHIYMAIRRPMKKPTSGTEVFSPITSSASQGTKLTTGFPIDSQWVSWRPGLTGNAYVSDRLRANSTTTTSSGLVLNTSNTGAENSVNSTQGWDNTGFQISSNWAGGNVIYWNFRRATGFFDVVCYTGTGSARTVAHNLGVAPELMIVKSRSSPTNWAVYSTGLTSAANGIYINSDAAQISSNGFWNSTAPTSTVFTVGSGSATNGTGDTYVAYLFATCPGVSKVGSYTGNGSNQTINCGFSAGARFVLIKATSTTGDWVVLDTARGIVSGNDPFLQLNSTAAEITNEDIVDPDNSGFVVNSTTEAINTNGVSYLYLAIA